VVKCGILGFEGVMSPLTDLKQHHLRQLLKSVVFLGTFVVILKGGKVMDRKVFDEQIKYLDSE